MSDGLGPVGRELRQGIGAELRADAEETERLVAIAARRRRTLADVARDLLARGDTVVAAVPGHRFAGVVMHAAGDLLRLRTAAGAVDLALSGSTSLQVVERAHTGGRTAGDGASSFKARLRELEMAGATVELGDAVTADLLVGRVAAVAVDHVVVTDPTGVDTYLPLAAVTFVRER